MAISEVCDGVWAVETSIRPGGGFVLPLRQTILRAADQSLTLVSPVRMSESDVAELAELGPVKHLVAPNRLHHLYAGLAKERFPEAKLWLAPGLAKKRPDLPGDGSLPGQLPEGIRAFPIDGARGISEFVLLHEASRTLVVTDLVFHVLEPHNVMSSLLLWLAGAHRRLGQSRAWRFMTDDRDALAASARVLLEQDFDRLVMAHGEIIHEGARDRLAAALEWMLAGSGRAPQLS